MTAQPARSGSAPGGGNPWLVAIAVMLATFMEVLDTSIAAVALPYIAGSLSATNDEATWVLTSYLVTHGHSVAAQASGAVHSYTVAFWVAAAIFAGAAVICGLILRPGVLTDKGSGAAAPVAA